MTLHNEQDPIIELQGVKNSLGGHWVHDGVNLQVYRHEILAIVGGSGSGKTTILRSILMLQKITAGKIKLFGIDIADCSYRQEQQLRQRWGMLFQKGALFSSLTVLENVMFPLKEFTQLTPTLIREIALLKISLVGLPIEAADKYPAQLSGGMVKRAACARAIALDPELLFLDEPSSGLDPKSAQALDELILHLREALGLTIVMVTHDLDSLWRVTDRVAFLGEGKVLACEPMDKLVHNPHPLIQDYFAVERGGMRFEVGIKS